MKSEHFYQLLSSFGKEDSQYYKKIVSVIVTALKREECILVTYNQNNNVTPSSISSFIEFITTSILPLSVSITNVHNKTKIPTNRKNRSINRGGSRRIQSPGPQSIDQRKGMDQIDDNPSPYLTNISIFESIHTYSDLATLSQVHREMSVEIDGETCPLLVPFVVFGITPDSLYLSRECLSVFSFHLHFDKPIEKLPAVNGSIFQVHSSILPERPLQIHLHRDLSTYIAKLVLRLDCWPLVTSYIDTETKLLLIKVAEDHAFFNGRDYILPEDIQAVFPSLTTHKFLLPSITSFAACLELIHSIIDMVDVPV